MTEASHAVFLSYASQDERAARRIAEALRSAGVEVWFDQSELRGGDVWDRQIHQQIRDCRLFIALISAHTEARDEGYFRREWRLAVDRTHDMAEDKTFVVPVTIDSTSEQSARVPDAFKHVQWTRLAGGDTPPAFVERVQRLLSPPGSAAIREPASAQSGSVVTLRAPMRAAWSPKRGLLVALGVLLLGAMVYFSVGKLWISKPAVSSPAVAAGPASTAFNPPPHSLAVLPFVNMSGDPKQEYFSDGLSEEILNALARINELHVAARTSAFSFKGKDTDIRTIAGKLNVGAILEGSVRRSANTVRITTQLIDASSGYHLWSETYDRSLGDVLKLETEIATSVAGALKVTLLGNPAERIEVGGTRNPEALNAYLRGRKAVESAHAPAEIERAMVDFDEAVRLDPQYARAVAARSLAWSEHTDFATSLQQLRASLAQAEADARHAIALAPELSDGHGALGVYFIRTLQLMPAAEELARAVQLEPGNAYALAGLGSTDVELGRTDAGLAALRRAATLDPLSIRIQAQLAYSLFLARHYDQAIAAFDTASALDPAFLGFVGMRGLTYYLMGNLEAARRACETESDDVLIQECRAIVYEKLGRPADAHAALAAMQSKFGDSAAYQYAQICAQWANRPKALEWLDTAVRLRDPGLVFVKTDPLMDPLRGEPRLQTVLRALKFPE